MNEEKKTVKIAKIQRGSNIHLPVKIKKILNLNYFDTVIFEKRPEEEFVRIFKWKGNPERKNMESDIGEDIKKE